MKSKVLIIIFTLFLGLLVGCEPKMAPSKVEPNPSESSKGEDEVKIDFNFNYNGNFSNYATTQLNLLEENLRLSSGVLSENGVNINRANLWTYSAYFTMVNQINMMNNNEYSESLLQAASSELDWYRATKREDDHLVYASQNGNEVPAFYDDNVWLVIGWINGYNQNKDEEFLNKAKAVMEWIYDAWDTASVKPGGLYWREFPDDYNKAQIVRNTCINGPAAWASALLYEITEELYYLDWALKIYSWTKTTLLDKVNFVYWDNIDGDGYINKWTFTYNQGTMMSTASLLYKLTKDERYKKDVSDLMVGAENVFYLNNQFYQVPNGEFYADNPWFRVYLVQGYYDATRYVDINYGLRLERVKTAILYGLNNHTDNRGFLNEDWSGRNPNEGAGGLFTTYNKTLFVAGNIEILAILSQYENFILRGS